MTLIHQQDTSSCNNVLNTHKKSSVVITALVFILIISLVACKNQSGTESQKKAEENPAMPVSVIDMQPVSVPVSTEAVAQTEGAKQVEIRPRVGGILLKKMFEEGAPIKAGQVMFIIDPAPFEIALSNAKAQLAQQQARVEQAQREEVRLDALLATQSVSKREADNAKSDSSVASASFAAYQASVREAELNLSYTTVRSPISGIAGRFELSEGALVNANTSMLTTVSQIMPIWVRFSLSESELKQLGGAINDKNVKKVTIVLPDGTEYNELGKLNFAASQIDPALGTQQLRAEFKNTDKILLPGQFVRVRITTGMRDGIFLVPQTAVATGDQGTFVFVANAKNQAERRSVKVGQWQGTDWIILDGLHTGDKVITDNLIKLNMMPPGAAVAPHAAGAAPSIPVGDKPNTTSEAKK